MTTKPTRYLRTLAIDPASYGVGYAVMEGFDSLVDWGTKRARGDLNAGSLARVEELILQFKPGLLVLQDLSPRHCRRSPRAKALSRQIITLAGKHKIKVLTYTHERLRRAFFTEGLGTKHELAAMLAERFPEELGHRLPPKRKLWTTEPSRMDIFDAVALALMPRQRTRRLNPSSSN